MPIIFSSSIFIGFDLMLEIANIASGRFFLFFYFFVEIFYSDRMVHLKIGDCPSYSRLIKNFFEYMINFFSNGY